MISTSASNAETTLTVQEEQIANPPTYPLPTEYWTRPIEGQNTAWASVASNWLQSPQIFNAYQPDGLAPNSAHVMWTKPYSFGGVVGGSYDNDGVTYYSGSVYESKFNYPIIMNGLLFYTLARGNDGSGGGYACVDLRTGEELWWQNYTSSSGGMMSSVISFGQLLDFEAANQHGVIPNGYLWAVSGGKANVYDSLTGNWLFTLTDVPSGTLVYGANGEITQYVLNTAGKWLALWNSSTVQDFGGGGAFGTVAASWRPVGKTANASTAYSWNSTIPALPAGSTIWQVFPGDLVLGTTSTTTDYTVWAISLKPDSRGALLWTKDYALPSGNITRSRGVVDPVNRVFIMFDKETISYTGYSIDNGNKLWGPTPSENPWNMYGWIRDRSTAYGKLFTAGYSGEVHCYDTKDGSLLWNYNASSGLASPYLNYPLTLEAIADGKIYVGTTEHSSNAPYWKGSQIRCLNATTGEEIWTLASTSSANGAAIADGYYVNLNYYDMQMYCIGKGPTQTTVSAPNLAASSGQSVIIRGTVTDISAGTEQNEQAARFPNGVPVASEVSMKDWMGYVYQQKSLPTNFTGVQVTINVIDSNGNYRTIGTTTTDENGAYSLQWMPDIEGMYKVMASFAGTNGYWPSHSETSFAVDPAAATPTPTAAPVQSTADLYFVPAIAGLFVAIIVVGALMTILLLRKRP